jgi:hypothetical protein
MTSKDSSLLFEGEYISATGRFSHEVELVLKCPHRFLDPANEWTQYGLEAVRNGTVDYTTWEWKSDDDSLQDKQGRCFSGFLRSVRVLKDPTEEMLASRAAVLAWMLSNMLVSPPEYRRSQRGPRAR